MKTTIKISKEEFIMLNKMLLRIALAVHDLEGPHEKFKTDFSKLVRNIYNQISKETDWVGQVEMESEGIEMSQDLH